MMSHKLPPRIKRDRLLESLFHSPEAIGAVAFPVRMVALEREATAGEPPLMLMVSVAKRHFKHAVDRNRAKRQLREAFRLNCAETLTVRQTERGRQLLVALLWLSDEPLSTERVAKAVHKALRKLL